MSIAEHLATGASRVCRAWAVTRTDGHTLGFTDHDIDLEFEGIRFAADSGLTASALETSSGLSVDNSEAIGALRSSGITEEAIVSGRFDGATVRSWIVKWDEVDVRELTFRGTIGAIAREAGSFTAELRGLSDQLNHPRGHVFQRSCSVDLGGTACGLDLSDPLWTTEALVEAVVGAAVTVSLSGAYDAHWFERGVCQVIDGAAQGLSAFVKTDSGSTRRELKLWSEVSGIQSGDRVQLIAGCDKRLGTCKGKFGNVLNFQGFPHIPGEDFLMSVPRRDGVNDGGSLIA